MWSSQAPSSDIDFTVLIIPALGLSSSNNNNYATIFDISRKHWGITFQRFSDIVIKPIWEWLWCCSQSINYLLFSTQERSPEQLRGGSSLFIKAQTAADLKRSCSLADSVWIRRSAARAARSSHPDASPLPAPLSSPADAQPRLPASAQAEAAAMGSIPGSGQPGPEWQVSSCVSVLINCFIKSLTFRAGAAVSPAHSPWGSSEAGAGRGDDAVIRWRYTAGRTWDLLWMPKEEVNPARAIAARGLPLCSLCLFYYLMPKSLQDRLTWLVDSALFISDHLTQGKYQLKIICFWLIWC